LKFVLVKIFLFFQISLHFCVECRQQMNDVEPGFWYKDKNIGRNRKLDEDIEVTFVDTSANFVQTRKNMLFIISLKFNFSRILR